MASSWLGPKRLPDSAARLRRIAYLVLLITTLAGCTSPEDGRPRGGGAGADIGNKAVQFKPESKVFTAFPTTASAEGRQFNGAPSQNR